MPHMLQYWVGYFDFSLRLIAINFLKLEYAYTVVINYNSGHG